MPASIAWPQAISQALPPMTAPDNDTPPAPAGALPTEVEIAGTPAPQTSDSTEQEVSRGGRLWADWGRPFLIIVIVMSTLRSTVADWNHVPTGSMEPTILVGDRIFVNKLAYDLRLPFTMVRLTRWHSPQPGDLIVFRSPKDGRRVVKRVIGLPGDTVSLRSNRLSVNDEEARYQPLDASTLPYVASASLDFYDFQTESSRALASHPIMTSPRLPSQATFGPVKVPDGHLFVLGDSRDDSFDSRFFGFVEKDRVFGRAHAIALSVDPTEGYKPRWGRFFQTLD